MLDLNHILLFIACVSPLVLLAHSWRRGGLNRGWRIAAFAVLLITGTAWILKPNAAGLVGGGAWLVLMLVPLVGLRRTAELIAQQRYASAWRLARTLRFLHPADGLLEQSELLRALECAQRGDFSSALALLRPLRSRHTSVGRQAIAQSYRIRGDWSGLLEWLRGELPLAIMETDFALQPLYLRALGETGARDELVLSFMTNAKSLRSAPQNVWLYDVSLLPVLAFGGRLQALSNLLETKLRGLSRDAREYWVAIGQLGAGETMAGRTRLEKLRATTGDALIRAEAAHRLERVNEIAHTPFSPATLALLRRIEQSGPPPTRVFASETARPTTVALILIALNVAMFVAECALGGSTNPSSSFGSRESIGVFLLRSFSITARSISSSTCMRSLLSAPDWNGRLVRFVLAFVICSPD